MGLAALLPDLMGLGRVGVAETEIDGFLQALLRLADRPDRQAGSTGLPRGRETVDASGVHEPPLPSEQNMQPPVAVAHPCRCRLLEPNPEVGRLTASRLMAPGRSPEPGGAAGPPLADAIGAARFYGLVSAFCADRTSAKRLTHSSTPEGVERRSCLISTRTAGRPRSSP